MLPILRGKHYGITRREPFFDLWKDVDELFDTFLGGRDLEVKYEFAPRLDVEETDENIVIKAELPGVDEKDIKLNVEEGHLILEGEKKEEREEKTEKGKVHLIERSYGNFRRVIPLYNRVDVETIKADFKKGVLRITMKKTEEAKRKAISIST